MILGIRVIKLYAWEDLFMKRLEDSRAEELRLIRKQNLIYGFSILLSVVVPAFSTVIAFLAYSLTGHQLVASVVSQVSLYFSMLDIPLFNIPLFINTGIDTQESLRRLQAFLQSERIASDVQQVEPGSTELGLSIEEGDFDWDSRTVGKRKATRKRCGTTLRTRPIRPHGPLLDAQSTDPNPNSAVAALIPPPSRLLNITPNTTYDMEEHTWLDPSTAAPSKDEAANNQPSEEIFCIRDIELKIPRGALVAIVGPVGSGKSSLLQAILGEMRSDGGSRVIVGGRLAYSPQQAWIMNGTIRENVLFGQEWNEERYHSVLQQCALDSDIASLANGDATLVGEKGVSLSGGQKARLNLARAVYADADVLLLDDPLSAVDARVCNHLLHQCILEGLPSGKTRLLVTHQLSVVPLVDWVVVMRHGRVSEQGTYAQLMAQHTAFSEMMRRFIQEDKEDSEEDSDYLNSSDSDADSTASSPHSPDVDEPVFESTGVLIDPVRPAGAEAKTVMAGSRPSGSYGIYIRLAGGPALALLALLIIGGNEFFRAGNDLWLTVWMLQSPWSLSQTQYRLIYVAFAVGLALLTWACVLLFTLGGIRAAGRLHSAAAHRLFRSPIGFFEGTPLGRILNRFSRDQEVVDTQLADCIYFWLYIVATMASTYLFLLFVSWRMALVLTGAFALVFWLQSLYSTSNWKLNKLYNQALSPFMRQVGEVHGGLPLIRTFHNEDLMASRFHVLSDGLSRTAHLSLVLKRWTSFRVELLGALLVLAVAALCWAMRLPSGLAGKLLEFTLLVINSMDYFVRQYAEMESNMVALDRLHSYATSLESEAFGDQEDKGLGSGIGIPTLDPEWPRSGAIELRDLTVTYKPHLPPVLHSVSLAIPHGQKVAIVGRTGAGKSTILSAIFRLIEPAAGSILIDGLDISSISLKQLRSRITIVPQDPVLFSGTLRFNMDPTGNHSDAQIWDALDAVNSRGFVAKLSQRLETAVVDFGENFSLGQRQLICLARAILHRSPVILMDEPTASMDLETDQLVQEAIRRCFANSTVINISHRLGMIREYDRVVVMDAGRIIEFDSPDILLDNPKSVLAQLYAEYSQF